MGFSRQEYWSGLPFPSPGDLPNPGLLHCKQILYHLCHPLSPLHCVDLPTNPGAGKMGLTPPPPPNVQHLLMQCCIQKNSSLKTDPWVLSNLFLAPESGDSASWCGHVLGHHQFSSVQFSHSVVSDSLRPHGLQHIRPPCPSPTPGAYSNSCPLNRCRHPTISSSVVSFSSHLQSFPASGSFPMSQFFTSGGQSTGVSASASVLPMNIQD